MVVAAIDTIAAIATPPGKGGVGIIRLSGKKALKIAQTLVKKQLKPRYATYAKFYSSEKKTLDQGIIVFFPNPNSFTGEDVIEFHGHGGPVILDLLLGEMIEQGARLARPGEFSERAFLNGKIDLAQAEAIADLIDAGSRQAAQAALNSLQGEFSKKIKALQNKLTYLRMYVEAAIDFPEEEIDFLNDKKIIQNLIKIKKQFNEITHAANQGRLLKEGINIVIIGKPNAGKSSLLNQLTGHETAIVTNVAGTTRDVLHETIQLDGLPVNIIDTAGLRESENIVELMGIERAHKEIAKADYILCLIDGQNYKKSHISHLIKKWNMKNRNIVFIKNKIDLINEAPSKIMVDGYALIGASAKTGLGLDLLKEHIKETIGFEQQTEGQFSARRRHLTALSHAYQCVNEGEAQLKHHRAGELLAEDLRQAQVFLSEITGEFTPDDLLGEIFLSFCIGK